MAFFWIAMYMLVLNEIRVSVLEAEGESKNRFSKLLMSVLGFFSREK